MKIFSAEQIYQADKFTIQKQQITSDGLMERAAVGIFNWIHAQLKGSQVKIHLFCGIGNNGGDGIALARHLQENNYQIEVYVVNYSEKRAKDFLINLDRLKERKVWPNFLDAKSELPTIAQTDIIVDAIFGIGLNRPPDTWVAHLITHLNNSKAFTLSVDIPSGLFMASIPKNRDAVIQADHVLSFQFPKLVFFLPQTGGYVGSWTVLDIGLDPEYFAQTETDFEYIGRWDVVGLYRTRPKFSHKGTFGHTVVIGGGVGKIGAVRLAAEACLTVGSGLVTAYVPKCGLVPLQTGIPEIMVLTDAKEDMVTEVLLPFEPNAIALGMGMGTAKQTERALDQFLDGNKAPIVLDADGLNLVARNPSMLNKLPKASILTPHPKELERLIGKWEDDFDKLKKVKSFSKKWNCIVVVKGAHSLVVTENRGYINATGNPGMATAGSGDVLAGMIAGLLAQGYMPLHAAIFGVYLHGSAGDLAAADHGYEAVTASRITEKIGQAYKKLFEVEEKGQASED